MRLETCARPELHPPVRRLANHLIALEGDPSEKREQVYSWIEGRCADIRQGAGLENNSTPIAAAFLEWIRQLAPSRSVRDWKLSLLAEGRRGSCLALVSGALLVGRSLGVRVDPMAVQDHLLLQVEVDGRVRLFDLVEGTREFDLAGARSLYRVPTGSTPGFLRPLTDGELISCFGIERGAELIESGDLRGAKRVLQKAIRDFPTHPSGFYNLGVVELKRKKWGRAEALFSRAISLFSNDARPWYNRALLYWKLGRTDKCRADLREALALMPEMAEARELSRLLAEKR